MTSPDIGSLVDAIADDIAIGRLGSRDLNVVLKTLREAAAVLKGDVWRDISTAPKDGTAVLIGFCYSGKFVRYVGHWLEDLKAWARDEVTSTIFPSHMQQWFTHWRPLPAAPKETE